MAFITATGKQLMQCPCQKKKKRPPPWRWKMAACEPGSGGVWRHHYSRLPSLHNCEKSFSLFKSYQVCGIFFFHHSPYCLRNPLCVATKNIPIHPYNCFKEGAVKLAKDKRGNCAGDLKQAAPKLVHTEYLPCPLMSNPLLNTVCANPSCLVSKNKGLPAHR